MIKVIIQDSDEGNLEALSLALETQGYLVQALTRSKYILEHIKWFNPNLIIINYLLSGEDSILTCKEIKEMYPTLPVMATTCVPNIDYSKHGFDGHLNKPFDIDDLAIKVLECLSIDRSVSS